MAELIDTFWNAKILLRDLLKKLVYNDDVHDLVNV